MKKVRLFRNHTQAGVEYPAGAEIELPDEDADYLLSAEEQYRAQLIENDQKYRAVMSAEDGDAR